MLPPKSLFNKTGIVTSIAKSDEIGKIAHLITKQVSLRALLKVMKSEKIATILPISSLLATLVMIPVLLTRLFGTEKPG